MPVHYRLRCAWQFLDTDPKNQAVINPCFRDNGVTSDPDGLCEDLATALSTWTIAAMATAQLTVTAYDVQGTKPVYPAGRHQINTGNKPAPNMPPELACCLSFRGAQNIPTKRGRLYVPIFLATSTSALLAGINVDTAIQTKVMALGPIFAGLGGADVDWIVWSVKNQTATKVTDYWTDNAWDIMRSRGVKPTSRQTATTSG
jgi:hypothetical protein